MTLIRVVLACCERLYFPLASYDGTLKARGCKKILLVHIIISYVHETLFLMSGSRKKASEKANDIETWGKCDFTQFFYDPASTNLLINIHTATQKRHFYNFILIYVLVALNSSCLHEENVSFWSFWCRVVVNVWGPKAFEKNSSKDFIKKHERVAKQGS